MNNIVIRNIEPQEIRISGGGEVLGIQKVYVNGIDVTIGSAAYVIVPTKTSELINDSGFITSESDPTVPSYVKAISLADINNWNNKQNQLVSGTNIKTINGDSLLGAGNLTIDTTYSAGTGIEITEENVINNTITSYDDLTDLPTIPDKTSDLLNDSGYVVDTELAEVAFNGSYLALSNTPTIPDSTSQLVNDSGYIDMDLLWSLFPKSTGSGTSVNLTDTVKNAPLYLTLGATELSQDGTPTPDSPQDIHTISGSNKVIVNGKNLFDNTQLTEDIAYQCTTNVSNEKMTITSTASSGVSFARLLPNLTLKPNTNYSVGMDFTGDINQIRLYDVTGNDYITISQSGTGRRKGTFTTNSNTTYRLVVYVVLEKSVTISNIQVEEGSTATSYIPYVTPQEADIDLGSIEYCKIGTYEDRIFKNVSGDPDYDSEREDGAWYIKKNIGKIILDGTQNIPLSNWRASETSVGWVYGYSVFNNAPVSNTVVGSIMCNKLSASKFDDLFQKTKDNGIALYTNTDYSVAVRTSDTTLTTTSAINTYLSSNPMTVYYPLASPEYLPITGTLAEQLETIYKDLTAESEQTNIIQVNADLPFTISATTLKSLTNL